MSEHQKKTKTLLRRGMLVLAALVLGVSIYRWNAGHLMGDQLPMPLGYGLATVLSGSMEPRLSVDDLVVIRRTDTVEPDDIIIYQQDGCLIIHRVIAVEGNSILTQGDANNAPDDPITMEAVKGVLMLDIPGVGRAVRFLRRPVVVILILAAIVLLMELSWRKEKVQDAKELDAIQQEIRQLLDETDEKM